jgi:hypothetical protein
MKEDRIFFDNQDNQDNQDNHDNQDNQDNHDTQDNQGNQDSQENHDNQNIWKEPPLHWAVKHNHWALFCFLHFVLGARITAKNGRRQFLSEILTSLQNRTPNSIFQKASVYQILKNLDPFVETDIEKDVLLEVLLIYKSFQNLRLPKLKKTLLHAAKRDHGEALQFFIDSKHVLDIQNPEDTNKSVLHYLIEHNNLNCLEILKTKVNVNAVDKFNQSPVFYALKYDNPECLSALLQLTDLEINKEDDQGRSGINDILQKRQVYLATSISSRFCISPQKFLKSCT